VYDVGASLAVVGTDERITQAQFAGQGRRFRLLGKEAVWSGFDDETLEAFRANHAAQTILALDEQLLNRGAGLARAG
jgi:hypothetical protein